MEAVVYARYSSDNQRAESITAQLRAIHAYALQKNIDIIKEYIDEAETGTNDERPNFQRMIDDLAQIRPNLILVHKLDRFARNRDDAGHYRWLFKKTGGSRLIAVDQDFGDTPEAALVESNIEGVAEYFSKNLSREVKKGLYENVVQGMHCGGTPPLGYDIDPDKKYVINEYEAKAVKMIFQMKSKGYSYKEISQALNAEGYLTKANKKKPGKPFGKNSLHDILRNEKYIGNYVYRKTSPTSSRIPADPLATMRLEGMIPRIIDDETFYQVQSMMDSSKQQPRARTDTVYILSGIARCAECGQALTGSSHFQKGKKYEYYRCNNAQRTAGQACSMLKRYKKDDIEQDVIKQAHEALTILRNNVDQVVDRLYFETVKKTEADNIERQEIRTELRKVQGELDNLIASIAAGVDAKFLAPKINDLGKKKESLERRMKRIESSKITREMIKKDVYNIISKSIDPSDPVTCRDDLKEMFGEIIIRDDAIDLPLERFGLVR